MNKYLTSMFEIKVEVTFIPPPIRVCTVRRYLDRVLGSKASCEVNEPPLAATLDTVGEVQQEGAVLDPGPAFFPMLMHCNQCNDMIQ